MIYIKKVFIEIEIWKRLLLKCPGDDVAFSTAAEPARSQRRVFV